MYAEDHFDPFSLISGILAIILGVLIFHNPIFSFQTMLALMAIWAIIEGVFKLFELHGISQTINFHSSWWVLSGIIDILFGIILFIFPTFGLVVLNASIAAWFIIDSLFELWLVAVLNNNNKSYYWLTIIFAVIGILIGILLLVRPDYAIFNASILLMIYLLIFGINQIVRSF